MRHPRRPPPLRKLLGFLLVVACTGGDSSCTIPTDISFDPGDGGGFDFFFLLPGPRAVEIGDSVAWEAPGGSMAGWSSSDTNIATVIGADGEARIVGRAVGVVRIRAASSTRSDTASIEVVASRCKSTDVLPSIGLGDQLTLTLEASDCRLAREAALTPWPHDYIFDEPEVLSLRAEGRQFTLTEPTLVRVDARGIGARPLIVALGSDGNPALNKFQPVDSVFVANTLGAGTYRLWIAQTKPAPTAQIDVAMRAVTRCGAESAVTGTLTFADTSRGTLSVEDCHSAGGQAAERWQFTTTTSARMRIVVIPIDQMGFDRVGAATMSATGDLLYYELTDPTAYAPGTHDIWVFAGRDLRYKVIPKLCPLNPAEDC